MITGDQVETDWQMERKGLLVGDLTDFDITRITGLASSAQVRSQDRTLVTRHGAVPGSDYLNPRVWAVRFEVMTDADQLSERLNTLNQAFGPTNEEAAIAFKIPGVASGVKAITYARVRRRDVPINLEYNRGVATVLLDLVSTDPLLYSQTEHVATTALSGAGGGLEFNADPDLTFGAVSSGGSVTVANSGNFSTAPKFRIDGPCTNPIIESINADKAISFDIELSSSEFLEIDAAKRTILLGGTASRYSLMENDSTWFDLEPGDNFIEFRADTATDATLQISWRDAWS